MVPAYHCPGSLPVQCTLVLSRPAGSLKISDTPLTAWVGFAPWTERLLHPLPDFKKVWRGLDKLYQLYYYI